MHTDSLHRPHNGWRTTLLAIGLCCILLTGCRRDLWIYTDDFRQIELDVDWAEAHERPDGMTWWFMNDNLSGQNRHETTAEVFHAKINLPRGKYSGIVFDYSPAEYSHVEFTGMTQPDSALVHLRASADQPQPDDELYGTLAVPDDMAGIPYGKNGMYVIAAEPELMNVDTINHVTIVTGTDGDLIRWEDRDEYQSTLTTQTLEATPRPVVWKLRVQVYVRGINYMYAVRGSVAGLADGCWLTSLRHTSTPCLQQLDDWQAVNANDSVGYITTTVNAFGLPDTDMPPSPIDQRSQRAQHAHVRHTTRSGETVHYDEHLRLNLQFLLRDRSTVLNYHFNVGSNSIAIYEDQLVVRIDIPIDYQGAPDLPAVDMVDDAGFDATVTPWAEGGTADQTM
jgi:hypothetical protein